MFACLHLRFFVSPQTHTNEPGMRVSALRSSASAAVSTATTGVAAAAAPASTVSSDALDDICSSPPRQAYLKPSTSPFRKPSIVFHRQLNKMPSYATPVHHLGLATPVFRIQSASCDYYALRIPLLKAGFRRLPFPEMPFPCNVSWGKSTPSPESAKFQAATHSIDSPFQKMNHFPRSHAHLGCKKGMAETLQSMSRSDCTSLFTPKTFYFPEQRSQIEATLYASPNKKYIWKPARGSCGRGIMICHGGSQEQYSKIIQELDRQLAAPDLTESMRSLVSTYVVQEYIENPLLIGGRKLDLRLYVGVTSYEPLAAYLHSEGLVRFAAQEYGNGSDISHRFGHLTNYSVGRKLEKPADESSEAVSLNLKWSLSQLNAALDEQYGVNHPTMSYTALMNKARHVIVATLMAAKPWIANATKRIEKGNFGNYMELYGFDIMFDAAGNAWLVEVNTLPSLESSSSMDYEIKSQVVTDLLNMAMIEPFERDVTAFTNSGLVAPESSTPRELIRRIDDSGTLTESQRLIDVTFRLRDEFRYKGGFERIFPCPDEKLSLEYLTLLPTPSVSKIDTAVVKAEASQSLHGET